MTSGGAHTVVIDAGTGSCRAVIFDEQLLRVGFAQRAWWHQPEPHVPGSAVFDTRACWALICECVREALARATVAPESVVAVTATSMREGMVLFDEAGTELWACPNVDGRAGAEAAELVEDGRAQTIYQVAGDWVAITAPPRFLWLQRHRPELLSRSARMGMLGDWILRKLGAPHVTDPSLGSSSAMFDLATSDWSPAVFELLSLDPEIAPSVVAPGSVIGEVNQVASAQTGLSVGTPVCAGGADTQLALLGVGASLATVPTISMIGGTFWQHVTVLDRPLIDPHARLRTLCHVEPHRWMIEGIGFWSGLAMRWLRDGFFSDLPAGGGQGYVEMEKAASQVPPGANGVLGLFSNVMNASRWVHTAPTFTGFNLTQPERSGRAECVRAVQEAAAYVAYEHTHIIEQLTGTPFQQLIFTGGGSQSRLWTQILADVTDLPVKVPDMPESTALGAGALAMAGIGAVSTAAAAVSPILRFRPTVEPTASAHRRYASLREQWLEVYDRSLSMSLDGLTTPMWRAAGA